MRLDQYLVEHGFFDSRNKAKTAILEGSISADGKVITKGSFEVTDSMRIEVTGEVCPYVSRGGYKLEAAIRSFYLDFNGKTIVDIGASTGGFTDCALQHGAVKVYAIDTGTDQLAEKLLSDERVVSLEGTNIKDVPYFPEKIDYFVMDVSFVSIEYLMPDIAPFITDENKLVCLIKPQFEVGKVHMKGGIVKDRTEYIRVIENIANDLSQYGLAISKLIPSPILGGSGNKEFLALVERNVKTKINIVEAVKE